MVEMITKMMTNIKMMMEMTTKMITLHIIVVMEFVNLENMIVMMIVVV